MRTIAGHGPTTTRGVLLPARALAWALLAALVPALAACGDADEPEALLPTALWPDDATGHAAGEPGAEAALFVRTPEGTPNGTAMLVIPGGGYEFVAFDHEGRRVADWLAGRGVTAFVLRYRHAPAHHAPAPLLDARRAIRQMRAQSARYGLAAGCLGVIGFSAGGHLAASAGTLFEPGDADSLDPVERESSRPDLLLLIYPVITMEDPYAHAASRENLLGPNDTPEARQLYSVERQVTPRTPPTFVVHTREDQVVPVENSLALHAALQDHGIPAALHVFSRGHHGLGLGRPHLSFSRWPAIAEEWLAARGCLDRAGHRRERGPVDAGGTDATLSGG